MRGIVITVVLAGDLNTLDDDDFVDQLVDVAAPRRTPVAEVVVGGGTMRRPEVSFLVSTPDARHALASAEDWFIGRGGRLWVRRVQQELVGAGQLAEDQEVSRQAVDAWTRLSDFPAPLLVLPTPSGGVRAWCRECVHQWLAETGKVDRVPNLRYLHANEVDMLNGFIVSRGQNVRGDVLMRPSSVRPIWFVGSEGGSLHHPAGVTIFRHSILPRIRKNSSDPTISIKIVRDGGAKVAWSDKMGSPL